MIGNTDSQLLEQSQFGRSKSGFPASLTLQCVYDPSGGASIEYVGGETRRLLGVGSRELKEDPDLFLGAIHPEDRSLLQEMLHNPPREETPFYLEVRSLRPPRSISRFRIEAVAKRLAKGLVRADCRVIDQSDIWRSGQARKSALVLTRMMEDKSPDEILEFGLEEAQRLTGSEIGFLHFVEPDQKTLELRRWSKNTLKYCEAAGYGQRYPVEQAGVWVDCLRQKQPVIHNDYASLACKKGLPAGHVPMVREATVPIVEGEKVVAIIGVGNKPVDYDRLDLELLNLIASTVWSVIRHKRSERALRENEAKYRLIVENQNELILKFGLDGAVTFASPSYLRTFGLVERNIVGTKIPLPVGEKDRAAFDRAMLGKGQWPRSAYYEEETATIDGRRWFGWSSRAVLDDEGGMDGIISVGRNITEQKQAQLERSQMETQLRHNQKMDALGTLAGGVAHDFNNILTAIQGFAELALDDLSPEHPSAKKIDRILTVSERAQSLVGQILAFSRKAEANLEPLDLNQTVESACSLLEHAIPRMIGIELELDPKLGPVLSDRQQLEQIVLNLCINAKDAMPDGGKISIQTSTLVQHEASCPTCRRHFSGRFVLLRVSDTGQGMSPDMLEHIFDPFYTTKEQGKGTGLGLSIVYGIVTGYGGHISCRSEPGRGTTFELFLPLYEDRFEPAETQEIASITPESQTAAILLVDDEQAVLDLAGQMLGRQGHRVLAARDGETALEIYGERGKKIDLVILDISMPGMGGFKCLDKLIAMDPAVKVIIISGYSKDHKIEDSLQHGASAYLSKPFRKHELLECVDRVLSPAPSHGSPNPAGGAVH